MSKRLYIFAGVVAILLAVTFVVSKQSDQSQTASGQPTLAFPALAASGQNLDKIVITGSNSKATLVKLNEKGWGVEELSRYPVNTAQINRLYLNLANLNLIEKRSDRPENHAAMGLVAPADGGAGIQIAAFDKAGTELAAIILGKTKDVSASGQPATLFVRRVGENQAWFARSNLAVSALPDDWVDKSIVSILGTRLSQVELRPNGPDPVILRRNKPDAANINLVDVPKGRKQDPAQVSAVSQALNGLNFESVKAKADVDMSGATVLRYSLFEGPVIDVRVKRMDGKVYATFAAGSNAGLSDAAMKEVADINERVAPFVYILPSYKADSMTPSKEALLEKPEAAGAAKPAKP